MAPGPYRYPLLGTRPAWVSGFHTSRVLSPAWIPCPEGGRRVFTPARGASSVSCKPFPPLDLFPHL